jgi:hypothetical protein
MRARTPLHHFICIAFAIFTFPVCAEGMEGQWKGTLKCGPLLVSPASPEFSMPISMSVSAREVVTARETDQYTEQTRGSVDGTGKVSLVGEGGYKNGSSSWATRFQGQFTGNRFMASGGIFGLDGTKRRECNVDLTQITSSPTVQTPTASAGSTESLHIVRLSRGQDLSILVGKRSGSNPRIAVLLFPGYPGVLKLKEDAGLVTYALAGNFLIRARRFLNSDKVFTVAVDCPVDQWNACDDDYRSSSQHASDITDVIASVRSRYGAQQVYVVGTSYGTVSSSFLARALGTNIDGAIHTATFTDPRGGQKAHGKPMASFDWSQAKVPQLFVHHKDDPCDLTRFSSVSARKGEIPLISVEGVTNPRGNACDAFTAHGFVGREKVVMTAIHGWITDRKAQTTIGADE